MSAVAKKRRNIFAVLFSTGVDVEDDFKEFNKEQQKALDNTDKRAEDVEKGFNFTTKSSNNSGGNSLKSLKVKENIKNDPQKNLEEMSKILKGEKVSEDKEIGEKE